MAGKHLCPSPTQVFPCQLYEMFENTFLQNTSGQLLLMNTLDGQKIYVCVDNFITLLRNHDYYFGVTKNVF